MVDKVEVVEKVVDGNVFKTAPSFVSGIKVVEPLKVVPVEKVVEDVRSTSNLNEANGNFVEQVSLPTNKLSRNDRLRDILKRYCSDTMSAEKSFVEIVNLFDNSYSNF